MYMTPVIRKKSNYYDELLKIVLELEEKFKYCMRHMISGVAK